MINNVTNQTSGHSQSKHPKYNLTHEGAWIHAPSDNKARTYNQLRHRALVDARPETTYEYDSRTLAPTIQVINQVVLKTRYLTPKGKFIIGLTDGEII